MAAAIYERVGAGKLAVLTRNVHVMAGRHALLRGWESARRTERKPGRRDVLNGWRGDQVGRNPFGCDGPAPEFFLTGLPELIRAAKRVGCWTSCWNVARFRKSGQ